MLTCDNISYKNRFFGVGFSLIPGALLAVYGADATGLIMLLAGKLKPGCGSIMFEDVPIARNREYKSLSLYIDCHPPFPPLVTPSHDGVQPTNTPAAWLGAVVRRHDKTVEQKVKRLAKAGGGAPELAEAALRYWGLADYRHEKYTDLPAHLQKRMQLTQLLTLPRPIWLLDHPEQGLDAEGLGMLDALIANRCNQNGIVIMATEREGFMTPLPVLRMEDFKYS